MGTVLVILFSLVTMGAPLAPPPPPVPIINDAPCIDRATICRTVAAKLRKGGSAHV